MTEKNTHWSDRRILNLFGIDHPIILAPMAGSINAGMAAAVSNAGGLGSLALAAAATTDIRPMIAKAKSLTNGPLNVNFFAHKDGTHPPEQDQRWIDKTASYFAEQDLSQPTDLSVGITGFDDEKCDAVIAGKPDIVSFHFGLPSSHLLHRLRDAGLKIISSATTVEEAKWLQDQGCDAIIAQGFEAGGHRGMFLSKDTYSQLGTFALVPQVVDAVSVPVIAAGGIADGRGIAAALMLGASAVQIGTAYLFAGEAPVSDVYRRRLERASGSQTALSNIYSGRPTRCIVNRMMEELGPLSDEAPDFPKGFAISGPLRVAAEKKGSHDFSPHYCGQAAPLAKSGSTKDITETLIRSTQDCIARFSA